MRLFSWLLDLLYPPKCAFCGRLLGDKETDLCGKCRATLPQAEGSVKTIRFCKEAFSLFYYEGDVRESIHRYKFMGLRNYASVYARQLAVLILEQHIPFDILTYVPVSARRRRKRGYDQARLLAQEIARELGQPCSKCLVKIRDNSTQSSLQEPSARTANVLGVYRIAWDMPVAGKRVLLIDDVLTTGATVSECSSVLLTAGAAEVRCLTLAAAKKLYKKQ